MRDIKRQFPHCWLLINWQLSQLELKQSVCFMVAGNECVKDFKEMYSNPFGLCNKKIGVYIYIV